jgi:hypothetical protein
LPKALHRQFYKEGEMTKLRSSVVALPILILVLLLNILYGVPVSTTQAFSGAARLAAPIQSQSALGGISRASSADSLSLYTPVVLRYLPHWARNDSYTTTCAEEDNVNIPFFAYQVDQYKITATHPQYDIGEDNCSADISGCSEGKAQVADSCSELFDDGVNVVKGCTTLRLNGGVHIP